jgi:hypothetical protein
MRRLCTDSSRIYLGRSAPRAVRVDDDSPGSDHTGLARSRRCGELPAACKESVAIIIGVTARRVVSRGVMVQKSAAAIVCAGQRVVQEGSSPSGARMRGVISERGGNASRAEERTEGMERPIRARRRKPETAKADLKPPGLQYLGGQGVHREVGSEGHEEKYRVVVEGAIR